MFNFFKKKDKNIMAVVDIWSSMVKVCLLDTKSWKIISSWEEKQVYWNFKNLMINDLDLLIKTINTAIIKAEEKVKKESSSLSFWFSWDLASLIYWKTFKSYILTIADEIWWKFEGFYFLPSVYYSWIENKKDYLILDIWWENSSVSLHKDWVVKKIETFPFWWNIFTRRIAKIFNLSFESAENEKILYFQWKNKKNILEDDFNSELDLFFTAFYISLKNFEEKLPKDIFLLWAWSLFTPLRQYLIKTKKIEFWEKFNFEHFTEIWLWKKMIKWKNIIPYIPLFLFAKFLSKKIEIK